jgi:hypothetical protein
MYYSISLLPPLLPPSFLSLFFSSPLLLSPPFVVTYFRPEALELLYPKLEEYTKLMHKMNKKARVVSIFFKLEKWGEWFVGASEKNNVFLYVK